MTGENTADTTREVGNGQAPIAAYEQDLRQTPAGNEPLARAGRTLDNVAFHDFAFYEFLLPTDEGYRQRSMELTPKALAYLDQLNAQGVTPAQLEMLAYFLARLEGILKRALVNSLNPQVAELAFQYFVDSLYDDYLWIANRIFTLYLEERELGRGEEFINDLYRLFRMRLAFTDRNNDPRDPQWWIGWFNGFLEPYMADFLHRPRNVGPTYESMWARFDSLTADEYPFEIFPPFSVNVGLRLVYRQEWKPLGIQPGEIVRTIPLGPGQKERVSTKIVRRRKQSRTMEMVTETETTTESTESTKDSSEIVQELTDTTNWNTDHKINGGFFDFIKGEHTLSYTDNVVEQSKDTASSLSEAMQKTAGKVRRETKVVVSTETEETFEQETASEILNPNDEIAITYEYLKLQQQYEVFTRLAEVESVIYVAEQIPSPGEVNEDWIRRYDWIIAKVLKDESYRQTLNDLIQDTEDNDPLEGSTDPFLQMLDEARNSFARFEPNTAAAGGGGLSIPDIYAEPQRVYQERIREHAMRQRANRLRAVRRRRFEQHIRDNILYYCQAIWSHEDPDQRMLRYKKEGRRVPTEWGKPVLPPRGNAERALLPTGKDAPLWELIDPTGPLGYVGNYAIFALRPLPVTEPDDSPVAGFEIVRPTLPVGNFQSAYTFDLDTVFHMMRAPYVGPNQTLLDPARAGYRQEARRLFLSRPRFNPTDEDVLDLISYLPRLRDRLLDANDHVRRVDAQGNPSSNQNDVLENPITAEEWGEYLYRKNGTRRFLVDSNNLYLNIHTSDSAALEPFKRAHRYLDVLRATEELEGEKLKNARRANLVGTERAFDPDIAKVVIVGDGSNHRASTAALAEALGDNQTESTSPVGSVGNDGEEPAVPE